MSFIRKIKRGEKIYYAEVENRWINGKCVQKHIRSLGTDPDRPTNLPIEPVHFSYLAVRLMQGDLTPNEVFDMLEGMGHPVTRDSLERIGINYDFGKKTFCIYLFYQKNSKKSATDAPSVKKDSTSKEQTKE